MISSSSSSDEVRQPKAKRYKLYLDADDHDHLSKRRQTRTAWKTKLQRSSQSTRTIISDYSSAESNYHDNSEELSIADNPNNDNDIEIQPQQKPDDVKSQVENVSSTHDSPKSGSDFEQKNIYETSFIEQNYNSAEENIVLVEDGIDYENDYEEVDFNETCSNVDEISSSNVSFDRLSTDSSLSDDEVTVKKETTKALFDAIMFQSAKLTVRDIIVMTTAFALRFNISDEAKLELINMLLLCAGLDFDSVNLSKHIVSQCFSSQNEKITYYYYCTGCSEQILYSNTAGKKLKPQNTTCSKCKKQDKITTTSSNNFISVDMEYQIKKLLLNESIANDVLENSNFKRGISDDENYIESVRDSILYKKIVKSHENENCCLLTLNFNTDGAPLNKSGKRSFWPVQLIINELSPKLQSKLIILAGIMIVNREPNSNMINLYLSTVLIDQINKLNKAGLKITDKNTKIPLKFQLFSCTVDSVARPVIQNRLQFNGYYGCSWCYQLGLYFEDVHGIRYPVDQESILRTNKSHQKDVNEFLEKVFSNTDISSNKSKITTVRGVRGICCLMKLPDFNMVWSFSFEYLHALLLGVVHTMWKMWKERKSKYKLSKKSIKKIEKRYLRITPIQEIHRLPRKGIIDGIAKPKGSELKSLLLYFGLPCLKDVLPEEVLDHYCLLVKSTYTLLKETIKKNELEQCERDLLEFVIRYEQLYGERSMTFNVHTLTHIVESIRKTGLLCHNSAFPYESNIYIFKKKINGPKAMDQQIAKKYLQILNFKTGSMDNLVNSDSAVSFCSRLFMPKQLSTFEKCLDNVVFCGRQRVAHINGLGHCLFYSKCIYRGSVLHSIKYKRTVKTDDTYVQMNSGRYGRILEIIETNEERCFLLLSVVEVSSNNCFKGIDHIKKIECEDITRPVIRSITNLSCKMMVVTIENDMKYLCKLTNNVEVQ